MLAAEVDEDSVLPRYMMISDKFDGIRAYTKGGQLWSRTNKLIPNLLLQERCQKWPEGLEGEIMLWEADIFPSNFEEIESKVMTENARAPFFFHIFDLPWETTLGYRKRYLQLCKMDLEKYAGVMLIKHEDTITEYHILKKKMQQAIDRGFEGIMLNDPSAPYKNGRSTGSYNGCELLKMKPWLETEGAVIGWEPLFTNQNEQFKDERGYSKRSSHIAGKIERKTLGSLLLRTSSGQTVRVGSGFTEEERNSLWKQRNSLRGTQHTFRYRSITAKGNFRSPTYHRPRQYE